MKIFITGGTGFFGKSLQDAGFPENAEPVFLSRDPEKFLEANPAFRSYRFIQGDVRSFPFPQESFDRIIHGATTASPLISDEETYSVIVAGTRHVLEFAGQCGAKKLLYLSSGAVYGPQPPDLYGIPEDFSPQPVTAYGKGKLAAEQMCLNSKIPAVIARGFAFIGKHLPKDAHFAAGNFLNDVIHDRPVVIKGDGRNWRSYLDADDLARMLWTLLEKGLSGEAYNVGSPRAVTIRELAEIIIGISGKKLPVVIQGKPSEGPAPRYIPDTAKISRLYPETVSLEDAIRKILSESAP